MSFKRNEIQRKKLIVFGFEGKNNKTETIYFHHFVPCDNGFILKLVSCGVTDPKNMLDSIKQKRKRFDYNPREDRTYLFFDVDCRNDKKQLINELKCKLPKDIQFIVSEPTFEIWFINHFVNTTKTYRSNTELFEELEKYVPNYTKESDFYCIFENLIETAIKNSLFQENTSGCASHTDVYKLFNENILKQKN